MKNSILSFLLFSMIMGLTCPALFSQYKITQFTPDTIRFDSFAANGLQPNPQTGELNSSHWRIKGLSDGNTIFGGSYSSGDYARGVSTGSVSSGGIYAFDNGTTGRMLGVQPIGGDFTPGSFTLKLQNSTSQVIKDLEIKYTVWFLNNEDRSNSFDFYYSFDDSTYTKDSTVNSTSLELADTLGWQSYTKISTLKNINIAAGDLIYLQWQGDDATGSGSRDEFGLDNIILTAEEENVVPTASIQIVHNSAAVDLDTVDIYMDDSLIVDNMLFRTASKFLSMPAETNFRLAISPSNSTDTNNAYYTQSLYLVNGERYVALLNGLWGNGYNPSSSLYPLNIFLKEQIRDVSNNVGNTDILFFHGCTDIGPLDIHESSIPAGKIVDNAEYGKYKGYYEYLTEDYSLEVYDSSSVVLYHSYTFMLQSYNLMDSAILVLSSGFEDPSSNNNAESYNMMYVPQIGGAFIPLNALSSSIGQERQEKDFLLYPNPAKNHLILESVEIGFKYQIYNVLGEKVLEGKQQSNRTFVDISELAPGTYIVNFQNAAANISKMFVK